MEYSHERLWWPGAAVAAARDALNAGYRYLEVKCDGGGTHITVDLTIIRRPRETPIWQREQRMRCKPCSEQRGYPYKRGADPIEGPRSTVASCSVVESRMVGWCVRA